MLHIGLPQICEAVKFLKRKLVCRSIKDDDEIKTKHPKIRHDDHQSRSNAKHQNIHHHKTESLFPRTEEPIFIDLHHDVEDEGKNELPSENVNKFEVSTIEESKTTAHDDSLLKLSEQVGRKESL